MKRILLLTFPWAGVVCLVASAGAPKVEFDRTVYDFGKTSQVETVSGIFQFKNTGDGDLKLEPPKPSCGCTVASLTRDVLKPGETGELAFSMNLGRSRANMEKHIVVNSNDPKTPGVSLAIRVDYTPLYELNPLTLDSNLGFGVDTNEQFTVLTRTDGKPIRIMKLVPSKPWIMATAEPAASKDAASARIRVVVRREGPPRRLNEYIHVYTADQTNIPSSTINLYGQVGGAVSLSAESLYWSVTGPNREPDHRPEAMAVRRLTISSGSGQPLELKNAQSTIQGLHVELVSKEPGKVYELVAQLDDTPAQTVSGNISFETSLTAQPRIEVPVIVNVVKR